MAKRKTQRSTGRTTGRPDVGGPRPDFKPDPCYRAFLDKFLAGDTMGAEFPCGDGNRHEIVAALRNVITATSLPVGVSLRGTKVLVMRTGAVSVEEPEDLLPPVAQAGLQNGQTDGQNQPTVRRSPCK